MTVATDFIPWSRHHMMMTQQLLHAASPTLEDSHKRLVEACPINHPDQQSIDMHANHSNACVSAVHPRDVGHEDLGRLCVDMAREAGMTAHHNPHTHLILGGGLTRDDVAQRFPASSTKETDIHFSKVELSLKRAMEGPMQQRQKALDDADKLLREGPRGHGLEIDVQIIAPDGQQMWLDVTMRHETCKTYAKKQLNWHRELRDRELEAYKKGLALPPNGDPTPLIVEAVKEKHRKYKPLLHLAHVLQLKKRNYARLPVFVAGAVSHSGEMAPELITFIEWVTGYRRRAAKVGGALYDGAPSAWVAEEFRTRFKAGIQTIIARTAGRIMASTGIPGTFSGQGGPRRRQMGT
jgi:hypothetical protein